MTIKLVLRSFPPHWCSNVRAPLTSWANPEIGFTFQSAPCRIKQRPGLGLKLALAGLELLCPVSPHPSSISCPSLTILFTHTWLHTHPYPSTSRRPGLRLSILGESKKNFFNHLCFGSNNIQNKRNHELDGGQRGQSTHGGLWLRTGWQILVTPCDTGLCPNDTGLSTLPGHMRSKHELNPGSGVGRLTTEVKTCSSVKDWVFLLVWIN